MIIKQNNLIADDGRILISKITKHTYEIFLWKGEKLINQVLVSEEKIKEWNHPASALYDYLMGEGGWTTFLEIDDLMNAPSAEPEIIKTIQKLEGKK